MYDDDESFFDWIGCKGVFVASMVVILWLAVFSLSIGAIASLSNQIDLRERIEKLEQKETQP